MADIKLFRIATNHATEIPGTTSVVEKELQNKIEKHSEALLAVQFLASEYSTGRKHGGRIDSLGIDENGCPVIIEYKRTVNENVINQGLFYLDWLLDHKAEFELLAFRTLGSDVSEDIDWSAPRLLCIASDFTRYDEHAVQQINRNIELIRYRNYGDDLLLLELVNAMTSSSPNASKSAGTTSLASPKSHRTVSENLNQAPQLLQSVYHELDEYIASLGDDVQKKELKLYFAYSRLKNFACVEVRPQSGTLLVFLKVRPDSIILEDGFSRDVSNIGHYGTGDLELSIRSRDDLTKAERLIAISYQSG